MSKKLVLYFSVYGTAKKVTEEIARQTGADLTEIIPKHPMTATVTTTMHWRHTQRRNTTRICALL